MKKVLVTGANGFIGRNSLPLLHACGYEIHATNTKLLLKNYPYVKWHQIDLLDSRQVFELMGKVRPTHLLHFAWSTKPGEYWNSTENFQWVKTGLDLMQAFASNGGQRVVMAGTCSEYNWHYGYCSEHLTPLEPASLYGTCKHALQKMLNAFSLEACLSAAWGRIFFLYGPHEHPSRLVASVVGSLLKKRPALCSHGRQLRDFLYVQDVADAFVSLLESDVFGPVNIASGQPVSIRDVVCQIAGKLNAEQWVRLDAIPTPADEPCLVVADVNRLTHEVDWQPKYDLSRGLECTIKWWENRLSDQDNT